jgi:hypothetical protein
VAKKNKKEEKKMDYKTATPNTPILSSAWNDNIIATKERIQNHNHTGGEFGEKITLDGLVDTIKDTITAAGGYETRIADLEAQVAALTSQVAAITVSEAPAITGFLYTPPVSTGNPVIIQGENFDATTKENNIVMFFNGKAIEAVGVVTAATVSELTVTVPTGAKSGRVIVIVNGKVAISTSSIVIA